MVKMIIFQFMDVKPQMEKPHQFSHFAPLAHLLEVPVVHKTDSFLARHKKTGLFSRLIQVPSGYD